MNFVNTFDMLFENNTTISKSLFSNAFVIQFNFLKLYDNTLGSISDSIISISHQRRGLDKPDDDQKFTRPRTCVFVLNTVQGKYANAKGIFSLHTSKAYMYQTTQISMWNH